MFELPMKYTPNFIANSNNLNFLPGRRECSHLVFHLLSDRGVDGTTKASVRGHSDQEVFLLVFGPLNVSFFIKSLKTNKKKRIFYMQFMLNTTLVLNL